LGESPLSVQRVDYHLPPTSKFEVQIQYDPALPPQQMFFPVAPGQKPVVRVLVNGESNQLWQPVQRQLWLPDGDSELPKQSPRRVKDKRTRIKCGLVQWRNQQTGESIEDICADGIIAEKTFYAYKKESLIYTDNDLHLLGITWADLWGAYQRVELEALIDKLFV